MTTSRPQNILSSDPGRASASRDSPVTEVPLKNQTNAMLEETLEDKKWDVTLCDVFLAPFVIVFWAIVGGGALWLWCVCMTAIIYFPCYCLYELYHAVFGD